MALLKTLGIFYLCLFFARVAFTLLFFVPSLLCLDRRVTVEQCGDRTFSQKHQNSLNLIGTFLEAGSSFLITGTIFAWNRFSTIKFLRVFFRLPCFWFWFSMIILTIISVLSLDFSKGRTALGVSLILEIVTLTIVCCALKFILKITVKRSLERALPVLPKAASCLYYLYIATLWAYLIRNLALFFYDTSILAGKIKRPGSLSHIDALLLIMNCATRGSFVQYIYSVIFRNPKVPMVCDNVELSRSHGVRDDMGGVQPLIMWETMVQEAQRCAMIHVENK